MVTPERADVIIIFEDADKAVEVRLDTDRETVWLTQEQMTVIFDVQKAAVSKHLKNIYQDGELEREATVSILETVRAEGKRQVIRQIEHYNLDAIISVGYRVNSGRAVKFRQWATRVLREHLTQGWTLSRQRFEENARELEAALALVRKAAQSPALDAGSGRGLVDIVSRYAQTFLLLQRYDEGLLEEYAMPLAINSDFEEVLEPFGRESANFFLAAALYHAYKLSFAAAASLADLSFEDFAARLREHFGTGFRLDEQVVEEDIHTVEALANQ
ncbi:MAG: virulence RhuM family protein [Pseudomonadota bacterium]